MSDLISKKLKEILEYLTISEQTKLKINSTVHDYYNTAKEFFSSNYIKFTEFCNSVTVLQSTDTLHEEPTDLTNSGEDNTCKAGDQCE